MPFVFFCEFTILKRGQKLCQGQICTSRMFDVHLCRKKAYIAPKYEIGLQNFGGRERLWLGKFLRSVFVALKQFPANRLLIESSETTSCSFSKGQVKMNFGASESKFPA